MRLRNVSVVLILVLVATACRGSDEDDSSDGEQPSSSATATEAVYPREITHLGGTDTLEAQPTKIITLGFGPTDAVVGLGVVPVGAFTNSKQDPFGTHTPLVAYEDQIPSIGVFEINLEVIAAAQPDLIVALSWIEGFKGYDEMKKIAPVMVLDAGAPWQSALEDIGYAMGLEDKADELLSAYDARAAEVTAAIPEGTEVALVGPEDNGAAEVNGPDSSAGYIATDAGLDVLALPDGAIDWEGKEGGDIVWTLLSKERLEEITSSSMIVLTFSPDQFSSVENDPLWNKLPAFQNDAVYVVEDGEAWFQAGPLGAMFALDQIESFYADAA